MRRAIAVNLVALVAVMSSGAAPAAAVLPALVADVNCDEVGSAADFTAAVLVYGDDSLFPRCDGAGPYRDRPLTDEDLLPIFHDIFMTFAPRPRRTATASASATPTVTPTRSGGPASPTPTLAASATATVSATPTPTFTATPTPVPTRAFTSTATATHLPSATRPPPPTATPTGIAFQLTGTWAATWTGPLCYLNGTPSPQRLPASFRVTAVAGALDIADASGAIVGRGLPLNPDGSVKAHLTVDSGNLCKNALPPGVPEFFVYDYTFILRTDGTGTASANWSYAKDTFCTECEVTNSATLTRTAGPGS